MSFIRNNPLSNLNPLMRAAKANNLAEAQAALASPFCTPMLLKVKDQHGNTPFMIAVMEGYVEIVEAILASKHCDAEIVKMQDQNGNTPLILAVINGCLGVVEAILASKLCDVGIVTHKTPLGNSALDFTDLGFDNCDEIKSALEAYLKKHKAHLKNPRSGTSSDECSEDSSEESTESGLSILASVHLTTFQPAYIGDGLSNLISDDSEVSQKIKRCKR